jgi:hypothetical protein
VVGCVEVLVDVARLRERERLRDGVFCVVAAVRAPELVLLVVAILLLLHSGGRTV